MFPFTSCTLASAPAMLLHCSYYDIIYPCLLYYFWAYSLTYLPCQFHMLFLPLVLLPNIPVGLIHITSRASLAHFIPWASSAHFILWASLVHYIISYFLHSHGLLLSLLGFPSPIATSFTFEFIGLRTNPIY